MISLSAINHLKSNAQQGRKNSEETEFPDSESPCEGSAFLRAQAIAL
jgi:hypothetical protein